MAQPGQFDALLKELTVDGQNYKYYSLKALGDNRIGISLNLPRKAAIFDQSFT